jgi:hypothetical protein
VDSAHQILGAHQLPGSSFPWRTATVVVGALAAVELVALIAIGAARLAPQHKRPAHAVAAASAHAAPKPAHVAPAVTQPPAAPAHPMRPRTQTRVLVLNGNGRQGAASTQAVNLQTLGYTVGGTENAPRHNYAQTMVMYVPGFLPEARRLARDIGARLVAPLDGLTPRRLKGSRLVVLLGS